MINRKTLSIIVRQQKDGVASVTLAEVGEAPEPQHSTPLSDFAAGIRENRQPLTSLENALVVQKITDGIYASAETGNAVEIGG